MVGGEGRKKKENAEEGECMAGLRPRKKRGKSWGEGAAAASLGFDRAPSFFVNVFFYFFCRFLVMAFFSGFLF
jgi:hypothetical protein